MQVTILLNDDETEVRDAMFRATDMLSALRDIGNDVFRPARKHGYADSRIQSLLTTLGEPGEELVSLLEDLYCKILRDYDIGDLL